MRRRRIHGTRRPSSTASLNGRTTKGGASWRLPYLSVLAKKLDTATELAENALLNLKAVGRTKHIESACTRIGAWFAAYDLERSRRLVQERASRTPLY